MAWNHRTPPFFSALVLGLTLASLPDEGHSQSAPAAAPTNVKISSGPERAAAPGSNNPNKASDGSPIPTPYLYQWYLEYDGGWSFADGSGKALPMRKNLDVDAQQAWKITSGDPSVVVAMLDSGLDTKHPLLRDNVYVNSGEIAGNKIDDDKNGYVDDVNGWNVPEKSGDVTDKSSSGTWLAGIIAQSGGFGRGAPNGMAPTVRVLAVKVASYKNGNALFDYDHIGAGLDYILKLKASGVNIRVVTLATNWDYSSPNSSVKALAEKLKTVSKAGISIVVPVFSKAQDVDSLPTSPAKCPAEGALSAMGVGLTGELSFNSDFGANSITIAAPNLNIITTETKYRGPEFAGVVSPPFVAPFTIKDESGNSYPYGWFVSNIAPQGLLAGATALAYSANPLLTPTELRDIIIKTAKKPGDAQLPKYSATEEPPKVIAKGFLDTGDVVQVAREGVVRGIVRFDGQPIANATVTLRALRLPSTGQPAELTSKTDAAGKFALRRPPVGSSFTVQASHPKYDLGAPVGFMNNSLSTFPNIEIERPTFAKPAAPEGSK